jgi:hypothetical protein
LQHVEDHTFTGEQHTRILSDNGNRLASMEPHSVEYFVVRGDLRIVDDGPIKLGKDLENTTNCADTAEDAVLLGDHGANAALARLNTGVRRRIARGPIFFERVGKNGCNAAAVPVHTEIFSSLS